MSFNIAVAGKGGTGKTSITSLVIRYLLKNGSGPILAIDADPNANLGESLGLSTKKTIGSIIGLFHKEKINMIRNVISEIRMFVNGIHLLRIYIKHTIKYKFINAFGYIKLQSTILIVHLNGSHFFMHKITG